MGSNLVIQSMPVDRPLPRGDRPKPDDPLPANQGGKAPMPVLQPGGPKARKRTCSPESPVMQMGGKPAVRSPRFERRGRANSCRQVSRRSEGAILRRHLPKDIAGTAATAMDRHAPRYRRDSAIIPLT